MLPGPHADLLRKMPWLSPTKTRYDRVRLLEAAGRARTRGRRRKAAALYAEVLRVEPENDVLRRRIALLLAQSGKLERAAEHYRIATRNLARKGFDAQACGVYHEALTFLPRDASLWLGLADLKAARGSLVDAVSLLKEGRAKQRGRRRRADAVQLLVRAHDLDPADLDVGIDLARLLRRTGDRAAALRVLNRLAVEAPGSAPRRILAAQALTAPTLLRVWCWLVADATPHAASG